MERKPEPEKPAERPDPKPVQQSSSGGSSRSSWWPFSWRKSSEGQGQGPIKANLGEEVSFYYDKEQKRWVNKNVRNLSIRICVSLMYLIGWRQRQQTGCSAPASTARADGVAGDDDESQSAHDGGTSSERYAPSRARGVGGGHGFRTTTRQDYSSSPLEFGAHARGAADTGIAVTGKQQLQLDACSAWDPTTWAPAVICVEASCAKPLRGRIQSTWAMRGFQMSSSRL